MSTRRGTDYTAPSSSVEYPHRTSLLTGPGKRAIPERANHRVKTNLIILLLIVHEISSKPLYGLSDICYGFPRVSRGDQLGRICFQAVRVYETLRFMYG